MLSALPEIFEDMGEEAVFTFQGGDQIPCHIFVEFDINLEPDGFTAQIGQTSTVVEALLSELNGIVPNKNETFTIVGEDSPLKGEIYTVQRVLTNDRFTVKVATK
jgi:hypothetical protein